MADNENPEMEEKGFNDDELQDIMNEIENLEKEFVEDAAEEVAAEEAEKVEAKAAPVKEQSAPAQDNVVAMKKSSEGAQMDFAGSGTMDFNLTFKVAGLPAHLKIEGQDGLSLNMEGVSFCIDESGCTVEMQGGVKFSVPWDKSAVSKKAA